MIDALDMTLFGQLLAVGAVGFVAGTLLPFGFRLIAYVVDVANVILGRKK